MEELVLFLFWKSVQVILNDVLETWVERVATAFGTRSDVDVIIPQLGSSVVVVRDDVSDEDRVRLSEILNRVRRGESLSDDDLAFLYTLG